MVNNFKKTDIGVIPDDWDVHELGNVAHFRRGSFPQPYGLDKWYDANNGMPFIQVYDVDDNMLLKPETKQRISDAAKGKSVFVVKGTIILTIQGSIGRIAVTQYDSYVDRTLLIFQSYKKPIDKWFFMYVVYQLFQIEKAKAPGGTIKTITKKELSNFLIPLPPSKAEQTAIATALSDSDALITQLEKLIAKKRAIKQGAMQELLRPKEGWGVRRLGEVCFPSKQRINPITAKKNYKCVELEHLSQGTGVLLGFAYSNELLSHKSLFQKGDILFGKLRPYLRKFLFAEFEGVCTTEIWVLKTTEGIFNKFLYHLVQSEKIVEAANLSTGTKMPRAEWKTVSETEIALPPFPEQTRIATVLSDMDSEITTLETKLEKYKQVKQGMMQQLLTGKIRLR